MIQNRTLEIIQSAIAHRYWLRPAPELYLDSELNDDLGCDELDRVSIAIELEEAFGIAISDDQASRWRTVADVIATVERLALVAEGEG